MSGNRKKKNRTSTQGTLLYMPAILIIFGIVVYPMLYALVMSFTGYSVRKPVMNFVGIANYIKILQDASFWQAVGRSLIFTFGSLIPQVVLGLAIAILLNHPDLRFKGLFRGLVIMPWLVPTVAVAMIFRWMFHDIYGIMNYILIDLHVLKEPVAWIANEHTAMFILILANVWRGVPMLITMFLAGLQGIPSDLYEAGQIDGANGWNRFCKITLPLPQVVLGLAIAILLNHPDLRFKGLFRGLVIMPWLVPTVAVAMIFRWMFHDIYGIMNYILIDLHVLKEPVAWIANEHTAMFILILANVWRGVPMLITMFLAGLQGIPSDLYEAGQIDGANGWNRFCKITLPLLMPVVMVSGILRFIWTFNFYDLPWVMTGGGPAEATQTTPIYAYRRAFSSYRMGEGSAITMILFVILIIFAAIYFILKKRQDKLYG